MSRKASSWNREEKIPKTVEIKAIGHGEGQAGAPAWPSPCPIALISTVLGIFSSRFQLEALRLTWDLKRVLTSVDLPSPL